MRYAIAVIFLSLCSVAQAQWKPVEFKKWQSVGDTSVFKCHVGGELENYPETDTNWAAIETDWSLIGDTMTARHAYLKADVLPNGVAEITVKHNDTVYTITQRPVRLIWLKTTTWNWIDVADTPTWDVPTIDNDLISWTNVFPGVNYEIQKEKGRVNHKIHFKPAFIDSAIVLYNQRPDSLDIALANVMEYTLSANIDNADIGIGNINQRVLKQIGKHVFGLSRSQLYFPGSDTLQTQVVNHRWIKQNEKIYCIEYIKMRKIKMIHEIYPLATIWHNASHTIEGTTNIDDAMIAYTNADNNYGAATYFYVTFSLIPTASTVIRCKNVASELGATATITDCYLRLYCETNSTDGNISIYRCFKPWVEGDEAGVDNDDGDVTWNDWASDADEWATSGAQCARDAGVDNSQDDGGCGIQTADRKSTAESTTYVSQANTVYTWDVSNMLAQGWYDETINEEGVVLEAESGNNKFASTEDALTARRPFWVFTYDVSTLSQVIIID